MRRYPHNYCTGRVPGVELVTAMGVDGSTAVFEAPTTRECDRPLLTDQERARGLCAGCELMHEALFNK